jgi:hypothetical protein
MNVPYEIKPIAPKGLGLLATRLIKKGEMILDPRSDDAAIAVPDAQLASYLGTYEPERIDQKTPNCLIDYPNLSLSFSLL